MTNTNKKSNLRAFLMCYDRELPHVLSHLQGGTSGEGGCGYFLDGSVRLELAEYR